MDQKQHNKVRDMIAAELAGIPVAPVVQNALEQAMAAAPVMPLSAPQPAQAPVNIVQAPSPTQFPLDEYEALMIDALTWRVESAEKSQQLIKTEAQGIQDMRDKILARCVKRLGIDVTQFNLAINATTKSIKIEKRG